MHTSIEQLIAMRDRQPVDAAIASHVGSCGDCHERLETLRVCQQELRELPLQEPSPHVFDEVQERINKPVTRGQRLAVAATVAAAAILIVTLTSLSVRFNGGAKLADGLAGNPGSASSQLVATNASTRELIRRSQALESVYAQLAQVPTQQVSAGTASALDALQNRLAMLDYGLNQSQLDPAVRQHINALWQRRVDTLQNMVGVRYAELARQGYHSFQVMPASYMEDEVIRW